MNRGGHSALSLVNPLLIIEMLIFLFGQPNIFFRRGMTAVDQIKGDEREINAAVPLEL